MTDEVPTVTIQTENGPVRINASDYDASKHTLYRDESTDEALANDGAFNGANDDADGTNDNSTVYPLGVVKEGKTFYVINAEGQKVLGDANISDDGYKTNKDAWAVVQQLNAMNEVTSKASAGTSEQS